MRRSFAIFLLLGPWLGAQSITVTPLDPQKVVTIAVSREVTTLTFPGAITAVAGADMLIDDGRQGTDVDAGANLRFHVSQLRGTNFVLVQSLNATAEGTLTVIFEGAAYVMALRTVDVDPVASVIFGRAPLPSVTRVAHVPPEVPFSPRVAFSLLDRARAYPLLARVLPSAVEGVTCRAPHRTVQLADVAVTVDEVYRFSREDAVVFLLTVRNTAAHRIDLDPSSFAVRVGSERFGESIATGPHTLQPGETAEAEFAVVGMPDGSRNDLSVDNTFTILVRTGAHVEAPGKSS